jgi:hypothetical protein
MPRQEPFADTPTPGERAGAPPQSEPPTGTSEASPPASPSLGRLLAAGAAAMAVSTPPPKPGMPGDGLREGEREHAA